MGRYYNGDIEGEFWFAVQSSDVAKSFGAVEQEKYCIDYVVYRKHLDKTHKRMAELESKLGDAKQKLDDFFEKNDDYNDETLVANGINFSSIPIYADWCFGKKIIDFFEHNQNEDYCEFTAEL